MPLGTRNWGGTDYHDSIFDPESQPQEYEQPYVQGVRGSKSPDFERTSFMDAPLLQDHMSRCL